MKLGRCEEGEEGRRGKIHGSTRGVVVSSVAGKREDPCPLFSREGDAVENGLQEAQVRPVVPNGSHDVMVVARQRIESEKDIAEFDGGRCEGDSARVCAKVKRRGKKLKSPVAPSGDRHTSERSR